MTRLKCVAPDLTVVTPFVHRRALHRRSHFDVSGHRGELMRGAEQAKRI
jgi:hypothetical protein